MFKYNVYYWDEVENKAMNEAGLVVAESWGKAVEKIREHYGPKNVCSITVEEWEDIVYAEDVLNGLTEK